MRGRDQARIILCVSGVEFEDIRPAFSDWPNLKTKFIETNVAYNSSLPIYEDSEVGQISESASIIRYLARKHHLDGATEREKVCVDMYVYFLFVHE
jgi:glutathione S-transferase